jgi:sulfur carrier protein ThiS adenylyltransferase
VAIETARLRLTIVVEGFDKQQFKKLLLENFADHDMPIVSASGIAGREIDAIRVHRLGNCTIVGDFQTDFRESSLYGPKISVIAAMMADFFLKTTGQDRHDESK